MALAWSPPPPPPPSSPLVNTPLIDRGVTHPKIGQFMKILDVSQLRTKFLACQFHCLLYDLDLSLQLVRYETILVCAHSATQHCIGVPSKHD